MASASLRPSPTTEARSCSSVKTKPGKTSQREPPPRANGFSSAGSQIFVGKEEKEEEELLLASIACTMIVFFECVECG